MQEHEIIDSTRPCVREHPALIFWKKVKKVRHVPVNVETLQAERRRSVYRLKGAGTDGGPIIAKRCRRDEAIREFSIYAKILPLLPLPTPRLYGSVEESGTKFAWLFLEDAGRKNYSPSQKKHRDLAAHWLGIMHTSMSSLTEVAFMRDRGPEFYFKFLKPVNDIIERSMSNPLLTADDVSILKSIVSHCKLIGSYKERIAKFCSRMPKTLVHGDFKEENMRVQTNRMSMSLMVFDWEESGWGIPALDYAKFLGYSVNPSIGEYFKVIRDTWPFMDIQTVRRLGYIGETFRCLASIRWEADNLRYEWIEKPMSKMKVYKKWLDEIIKMTPWKANSELDQIDFSPMRRHWY